MVSQRTIKLKNQLSELERASQEVESFCAAHGIAAKTIFQINLALDEVLTNVISYGYADAAEHDITVHLASEGGELALQVEDDGRAFNPLEVPAPDLDVPVEDRSIGGLGMHLVRKTMDRLEYRREAGKNVLIMRKATG